MLRWTQSNQSVSCLKCTSNWYSATSTSRWPTTSTKRCFTASTNRWLTTNSTNRWFTTSSTNYKRDLYADLKVTPQCTPKQIKSAYYDLCLIHHPDKNLDKPSSHKTFAEISEAYKVLGDPNLKKEYDRERGIGQSIPRTSHRTARGGRRHETSHRNEEQRHETYQEAEEFRRRASRVRDENRRQSEHGNDENRHRSKENRHQTFHRSEERRHRTSGTYDKRYNSEEWRRGHYPEDNSTNYINVSDRLRDDQLRGDKKDCVIL